MSVCRDARYHITVVARWLCRATAALIATLMCLPVAAQTTDASKFQAYLNTPGYQAKVQEAISRMPPEVFQRCPALKSNGSKVTLTKSIEFGPDGGITAGEWIAHFPIAGCGNDTILNIYFQVSPTDSQVHTVNALPGSTIGTLILQRDALRYAATGFGAVARDCKDVPVVKNTKFEGFGVKSASLPAPKPGEKITAWWETWTLSGCGNTLDVPVSFVPDATGTNISVSSKDVVPH